MATDAGAIVGETQSISPEPPRSRWLDPTDNSLNIIRLFMALAVVYHHIYPLTDRGDLLLTREESVGGWAVFGFFMISGYLITGARLRSDGARYLMNRIVRLLPAFFVVNIITAFVLAPIAYAVENGTLSGFLTTHVTPMGYIITNAWLKMNEYSIAGTLATVPYPGAWNGSLWSLYYEFVSYILVGLVCIFPFVQKKIWPMATVFALTVVFKVFNGYAIALVSTNPFDMDQFGRLLPFFFGGALVFMAKDRLRLTWWAALGCFALSAALITLFPSNGPQISAPLLTYVLIWIGARLPSPRFLQVHDFSYGAYVWGFPLTQMACLFGLADAPLFVITTVVVTTTMIAAAFSWFFVERPMMRWSRGKSSPFGQIMQEAR